MAYNFGKAIRGKKSRKFWNAIANNPNTKKIFNAAADKAASKIGSMLRGGRVRLVGKRAMGKARNMVIRR